VRWLLLYDDFQDQLDQKNRDHYRDSDKSSAASLHHSQKTECGTGVP
jgi:hypothetical protein